MIDVCLNYGSNVSARSGRGPESRRVAFDPHYGRVWVICLHCGLWNLLPIEERWEVLRSCEEQFAAAKSRVSVGGITQAETESGEVLIRIGDTPFADLARYRYLDTTYAIGRSRYRRLLLRLSLLGCAYAALGMLAMWGLSHGLTRVFPSVSHDFALLGSGVAIWGLNTGVIRYWFWRRRGKLGQKPFITVETDDGPAVIRWDQVRFVKVCSSAQDRSWSLCFVHDKGEFELRGPAAEFYLGLLLARVGQPLYSKSDLERALQLIKARGGAGAFLESFALGRRGQSGSSERICVGLMQSPRVYRIAAAIAVDECLDRREIEADIESLRMAARSAGEIAGISDDLLLPSTVTDALDYLRSKLGNRPPIAD